MTEEAILKGCLNNDAAAQRELYNKYCSKMLAVCYRYGHNREDAEDMLQEGFIKVFLQIHTFENRGAFEGWVRRIIVHTCINILKKNKKFNESVDIIYARKRSGNYTGKTSGRMHSVITDWLPYCFELVCSGRVQSPGDCRYAGYRRKHQPKPIHQG